MAFAGDSRRPPEAKGHYVHLPLDLADASAYKKASERLSEVTHVIYAAVSETPGLISGWRDRELMAVNLAMLRNLLDPFCRAASGLKHITLLQGAKAYGAHAGFPPPMPAREDAPRILHENFYWLQEDYLRGKAEERGLQWTVFRPQVVIGAASGAVMNPLLPLAAYGLLRREEGKHFAIRVASCESPKSSTRPCWLTRRHRQGGTATNLQHHQRRHHGLA